MEPLGAGGAACLEGRVSRLAARLHARRADVHRRLRLLDSGPNKAWDDVRDAEVAAWTELQAAFTTAAIRYG